MGGSVPSGPSDQQQKEEAELERQRVKYEDEKRRFIEKAAQNELLARQSMDSRETGSFEFAPIQIPQSGITTPERFTPSMGFYNTSLMPFSTINYEGGSGSFKTPTPDWYWAPNLGIVNPYGNRRQ